MATRAQVEAKIAGISDGGNNTAAEVRAVLTDLLDYTENTDTGGGQLPLFEFWEKTSVQEDKNNGLLWYSFRGIERTSVNFTFRLIIKEANATNFRFKLDPEIYETLNVFFQQYDNAMMSFVVAVTDAGKKLNRVWMMSFMLREDGILRIALKKETGSTNDTIRLDDEVFTSIQFHCPPFDFDRK